MNTREIHKLLVEHGLEPFEGISQEDIDDLVERGQITEIQGMLIGLTCPEYVTLKREVLDEKFI